jgi:hypothetical protein
MSQSVPYSQSALADIWFGRSAQARRPLPSTIP